MEQIIFVFLLAYDSKLSLSTSHYLKFMIICNFKIIFISNVRLDSSALDYLKQQCFEVIERDNLGRDIGGYKDGFLHLIDNVSLANVNYLMFANDSVFFLPGAIANSAASHIIECLNKKIDIISSHRNYTPTKHYQSFFMIFSREVFAHKSFISFWRSYIPLNNRYHSIYGGEIALSQKVLNKFSNYHVMYNTMSLTRSLISSEDNHDLKGIDISALVPDSLANYYTYDSQNRDERVFSSTFTHYGEWRKFLSITEKSNQTHTCAFIYPILCNCPIVKKDLCFAGTFSLSSMIYAYSLILKKSINSSFDAQHMFELLDEISCSLSAKIK